MNGDEIWHSQCYVHGGLDAVQNECSCAVLDERDRLRHENEALKSALAATQERLAQMERDEDMRRTLNR